ncbi:hypothetical protein [Streptomyces sp. NPDC086838]|uniref:hypothetical protein n=1 Tax=Streptomyces sp. NPDC086838 TaxID=3365762 RepID=UPI0037FB166D
MPISALITRVREDRADALAADAMAYFVAASDMIKETPPDAPDAYQRRVVAHQLAARAERLTARSYWWRPAPTKEANNP